MPEAQTACALRSVPRIAQPGASHNTRVCMSGRGARLRAHTHAQRQFWTSHDASAGKWKPAVGTSVANFFTLKNSSTPALKRALRQCRASLAASPQSVVSQAQHGTSHHSRSASIAASQAANASQDKRVRCNTPKEQLVSQLLRAWTWKVDVAVQIHMLALHHLHLVPAHAAPSAPDVAQRKPGVRAGGVVGTMWRPCALTSSKE
eukprot:2407090-Rhodomonas_salina.2